MSVRVLVPEVDSYWIEINLRNDGGLAESYLLRTEEFVNTPE